MAAIDYTNDSVNAAFVKLEARATAAEASSGIPTVAITAPSATAEGNSGTTAFAFPLTLTRNGSTAAVAYSWAVSGTGANPANATDFGGTFPSGTGVFASNETSKTITVLVSGDTTVEPTESFLVTVTPSIALTAASATGTITNDDVTPTFLSNFPKAQSKRAANQRAVIYYVGDSVTAGWGSGIATGPGSNGAGNSPNFKKAQSHPTQFSNAMIAAGLSTRSDAFFPSAQVGDSLANIAASEPRVTFGAGWTISNIATLGGAFLASPNGNSGIMTFAPLYNADSFEFLVTGFSGLGQLTVTDANGTLGVIDESVVTTTNGVTRNGTSCFRRVVLTRATPSTSPISIQRTGTGDVYIAGIMPFDTTAPRVELINMGWPGSRAYGTTNSWSGTDSSNAWDPLYALGALTNGDGFLIELGANDAAAGASAANFQSGLQTLITKVAPIGNVVLAKTNSATDSYNVPAGYLSAVDSLVTSNTLKPAVDYNSIALSSTDRFDSIHLSQAGYAKKASALQAYVST